MNIYQIIFLVLFIYHLIMFRVEKVGGHYEDDVEEREIIEDDFTPGDCETCKVSYENCYSGNCPIKIDKDDPGILYLDVK